ncbi:MAG: hypothetical protein AAF789_04700, partial [Bacteroidota bacterium]
MLEHISGDLNELYEDYLEQYPIWKAKLFHYRDCIQLLRPLLLKSILPQNILKSMFFHHTKLSIRNLIKYKKYTVLNVSGLVLGLSATISLLRVVHYERSFDQFHTEVNRIYRIGEEHPEYAIYYQTRPSAAAKIKEEIP